MSGFVKPVEAMNWKNIIVFAIITLGTVVGAPLYIWKYGITVSEVLLTVIFMIATGMGITVGYHRLFAHLTFQAHPVIKFIFLFFGAAAFEQSALKWASQHRDHHRYVDTDLDPYNIKQGFFYAHMGWLIFWKHSFNDTSAPDLQKDAMVMHQHKYYVLWALGAGLVFPVLIGAMMGHALGAFIFAVCVRLMVVYNATFCINSVCHMFGTATYDIYSTAKDHWLVALITNGEGYHNFHHRFPSDYRNGVRWYHWDPSKWLIQAMAFCGMAWDLKSVSKFRILEARLSAEKQRVRDWASQTHDATTLEKVYQNIHDRYELLRGRLTEWEKASKEYQLYLYGKLTEQSKTLKAALHKKMHSSKDEFREERADWRRLVRSPLGFAVN